MRGQVGRRMLYRMPFPVRISRAVIPRPGAEMGSNCCKTKGRRRTNDIHRAPAGVRRFDSLLVHREFWGKMLIEDARAAGHDQRAGDLQLRYRRGDRRREHHLRAAGLSVQHLGPVR